jgi:anthranilate synthase component II
VIYLIDNYDSFSYNLYQLIGVINPDIRVVRNDAISIAELQADAPDAIILSPGPGRPEDAGICEAVVREIIDIPILGICLGHQAICSALGATVTYARELKHGKQSVVTVDGNSSLFQDIPINFLAGRYHSLGVSEHTLPDFLQVIARTDDDEVMAVQHRERPLYGLQFHPESILTPNGPQILNNFLQSRRWHRE